MDMNLIFISLNKNVYIYMDMDNILLCSSLFEELIRLSNCRFQILKGKAILSAGRKQYNAIVKLFL